MQKCGFVAMRFPANVGMWKCGNVALTSWFAHGRMRRRKPYSRVMYITILSRDLGKFHYTRSSNLRFIAYSTEVN